MRKLFQFAIQNNKIIPVYLLPVPQTEEGIFTTIKVKNLIPLFLNHHIQRLGLKKDQHTITLQIESLLQVNNAKSAAVRISVYPKNVVLHATALPKDSLVSAVTIKASISLAKKKVINRTVYNQAKEYVHKKQADEAIFIANENLLESTIANIIAQDDNGSLITPILKNQGLKGITRQVLLSKGYIQEKEISSLTKGPLVLINSLRVMGVSVLNNKKLINPISLKRRVQQLLLQEEEGYENSYHR